MEVTIPEGEARTKMTAPPLTNAVQKQAREIPWRNGA